VGTFAVKTWAFLACTGTSLLLKSYLDYTDIGITLPLHPTEPQAANLVFEDQVPPTWYQGSWEENRGVKGALGLRSWLHKMEYISPEGLRQDGRRPQELRQLKCEIGFLPKADGSAVFEMGSTKVDHPPPLGSAPHLLHHPVGMQDTLIGKIISIDNVSLSCAFSW